MWATSDGPRIEDFGITEADLSRAPRLFFPNHRVGFLCVAYVVAAVAAFSLFFQTGHSIPAAVFFTVIVLAAASILLLPALVLLLCAGEQVEERWLCRKIPTLRACLAYQRALAEHRRSTGTPPSSHGALLDWSFVPHSKFVEMLRTELDQRFGASVSEVDREDSGYDFRLQMAKQSILLRCESGTERLSAALGRELSAAVSDSRADGAVILTVAKPTRALESYIAGRPITIASPSDLETIVPEI